MRSLDILVPTRDRPTRLAAMLGSLTAQQPPSGVSSINLYLLDNGGTSVFADFNAARQLDVLETRGIRTFYLRRPHLTGIYAVRRHLYEAGDGDVVVYIDDDVVLPPGTLSSLWKGVIDVGFALAASLVIDVDGLHEGEIGFDHHVGVTLRMLADQVERENLATVDDTWMEMVSPFGTNLMFRRDVFDTTGGWETLEQFFSDQRDSWGEDIGVCVALKSAGDAFIDISRIVLHLSPRKRSFTGWETPERLSQLLTERFGAGHPSGLPSRRRDSGGGQALMARLRSMATELSR
jgi:glycosyltransferase involved in cell wall biosynthesis